MKLSLWTLYTWMRDRGVQAKASISEGYAQICALQLNEVRTYSPAHGEILPAAAVRGGEGYDLVLANEMDMVFVKGLTASELTNMLADAFAFYTGWEQRLYAASMAGAALQELLDIAHGAFDRPMIIKSDGSWIYAITKGYPAGIHPYWAQMEADSGQDVEDYSSVQAVSTDPDFQVVFTEKYPSIIRSPSYGGMILHANLFSSGRRVGEIIALENDRAFDPGETHIMHEFAQIVEQYIRNNFERYISAADPHTILRALIGGGQGSASMGMIYSAVGLRPSDELCLAVIEGKNHSDMPMLSVLRERLSRRVKNVSVFSLDNQVVCLMRSEGGRGAARAAQALGQLILEDVFVCGVSYEFTGLEELPLHYKQAQAAMGQAARCGRPVMTLYEAAYECLCSECRNLTAVQVLTHPDVARLRHLDETDNTQYCQTLFCYLIFGGNYTDAAGFMGMHRNSLIYRMEKIRRLMRTNPDDMENRRLLICTFLMTGQPMT